MGKEFEFTPFGWTESLDISYDAPELNPFAVRLSGGRKKRARMAPPARTGMEPGWQLVVFGSVDHCSLAIDKIDEHGEDITALTSQTNLLNQVVVDNGEMRVELYHDSKPRRGMSQVMFELVGADRPGWFRVVHRDPSLRALSARLDQGK